MSLRSCLLVVCLGALLGAVFVVPTVMAAPGPGLPPCNSCPCKNAYVVKAVGGGAPVGLRQDIGGGEYGPGVARLPSEAPLVVDL